MKHKLLLASLYTLIGLAGQAQFTKGTRMIGATIGTLSFTNGTADVVNGGYSINSNNWNVSLSPSYGVFLSARSAVGGSLFVNTAHQKSWIEVNDRTVKEDNSHNTDYGIGVFYRHYFNDLSSLHPFAHIYVNGGSGITKTDGFYYPSPTQLEIYKGKSSDRFFYNAGINAGVTKMLSATVGFDASIGYVHSYSQSKMTTNSVTYDQNNMPTSSSQSFPDQHYNGNGVNLSVGLQVFLAPKRQK